MDENNYTKSGSDRFGTVEPVRDEIDDKLTDILFKAAGGISDMAKEEIADIKQAFKDAGYIHIPSSKGRNVTVYTSDNNEPLMTEDEWTEKHGQ